MNQKLKFPIYFFLLFASTLIFGALLRFFQLDARPLHHDEGVNFSFLQNIERTGLFAYSNENFHGPSFFLLSFPFVTALANSEVSLRLLSIICGILLSLTLLPLRSATSQTFILLASLFFATSPSLVFFSRYAIHEPLFVLTSLWLAISLARICLRHSVESIYWSFFALALMIATKETWIITLFSLLLSSLLATSLFLSPKKLLTFLLCRSKDILIGAMLFVFLTLLFFSWGFKNSRGIRELVLGIPQWISRGTNSDVGHFKPFAYYLQNVIWKTEPQILIICSIFLSIAFFAFFALLFRLKKLRGTSSLTKTEIETTPASQGAPELLLAEDLWLGFFLASWAISTALIYSLIPYKTVWLVINITVPALLVCAWTIASIRRIRLYPQLLLALGTLAWTSIALRNTIIYNYDERRCPILGTFGFTFPYGPNNPFSYVHSSPGLLDLVEELKAHWATHPEARVLIGVTSYWPLPYYLREFSRNTSYVRPDDPTSVLEKYDILVLDNTQEWNYPLWKKKYYRLSDVQEALVFWSPSPRTGLPILPLERGYLLSETNQKSRAFESFWLESYFPMADSSR